MGCYMDDNHPSHNGNLVYRLYNEDGLQGIKRWEQ